MFSIQKFYRTDIEILRDLGYKVQLSNNVFDFLQFWKYDIAFIYFYRYGLFASIFAKIFNKPVLFTGGIDYLDRNYAGFKSYYIQKLFFQLCSLFSDKNIIVSNSDLKNINRFKKNLPLSKYPISFHSIDFDKFRCYDLSKRKKIISTIVWMIRSENVIRKGVDKSILLFKEIYKIDPEFRMVIIGSKGEGTKLLQDIIIREGLSNVVCFTDTVDESTKISILKESSIYTQLSIYEGFGIAAAEALAAGNLVIHTGCGGLSDAISQYGIKVNNDNYQNIALDVLGILSDATKRERIIKNGIMHISDNFTYAKRYSDFKNIFNTLK